MLSILLLMSVWVPASVPEVAMDPALVLESIPEDSEEFLRWPGDVAIDENGRIMVLDLTSNTIFAWDGKGKYLGRFGKMGQGPGEFNFRGNVGGSHGYISPVGSDIFIYAGGNKTVSVFDGDLAFKSVRPFQITSGRTELFRVLNDGTYLIFSSSYFADTPSRTVGTYTQDGALIKEFRQVPDETWHYSSENGQRRVVLHPYASSLYMAYNEVKNQVIVGDTAKPSFDILSPDGKTLKTVAFNLVRKDVTDEDKKEFEEQNWFKNQSFFKVEFPDKKAVYNKVLAFGSEGYLVFLESVNFRIVDGVFIDAKGNIKGKLNMQCGERGGLFGSRERIIAVTVNEDEEFMVQEMKPRIGKGEGFGGR